MASKNNKKSIKANILRFVKLNPFKERLFKNSVTWRKAWQKLAFFSVASSKGTSFMNYLHHFILYLGHMQQHYKELNAFSLNPQEMQLMATQLMAQNSLPLFYNIFKPVESVCKQD